MDRWTRKQIITSFENYDGLNFWEQEPSINDNEVNALSVFYKNLKRYQCAYRNHVSHERKPKKALPQKLVHLRSRKESYASVGCKSLKKIKHNEKDKLILNGIENIQENLLKKESRNNLDLSVKDVKFDLAAKQIKKKRDRHKEIFGEKPKYIFKKVRTQSVNIR